MKINPSILSWLFISLSLHSSAIFSANDKASAQEINRLFQSALDHHEGGLLDISEKKYLEVLKLNPSYVSAHINMGNLLSSKGDYPAAESHYLTAIKLNPRSDDANYNLGAFYLNQKKHDEALKYFQRTVDINRRHKGAWLNLAGIYMRFYRTRAEPGLWTSARDSLMRAAEIDRNYPHIYYNFGMLHEMKNEYGIALQYYREALRLYKPDGKNYEKTRARMDYIKTVLNK